MLELFPTLGLGFTGHLEANAPVFPIEKSFAFKSKRRGFYLYKAGDMCLAFKSLLEFVSVCERIKVNIATTQRI